MGDEKKEKPLDLVELLAQRAKLKEYCTNGEYECAERIFYPTNPSQFITCNSDLHREKCHLLEDNEANFFEIIDKEELYKEFNNIMSDFIAELNDNLKENETIKNKLKKVYDVDVTSLGDILRVVVFTKTNDQTFCHDIISNVGLNTTPDSLLLFHISIHPNTSRSVVKGTRKNRVASCGYFKKYLNTEGSGAFHYKIDSEGSGDFHYKLDTEGKKKLFKKFITEADGTFSENIAPFIRKGDKEADTTKLDLYYLHNFFYNEFIKFWNNIIVTPRFKKHQSKISSSALHPRRGSSLRDPPKYSSKFSTSVLHPRRGSSLKYTLSGGGKRIRRKTIKKRRTKKRKTNKR
jgi:hypothetical protein